MPACSVQHPFLSSHRGSDTAKRHAAQAARSIAWHAKTSSTARHAWKCSSSRFVVCAHGVNCDDDDSLLARPRWSPPSAHTDPPAESQPPPRSTTQRQSSSTPRSSEAAPVRPSAANHDRARQGGPPTPVKRGHARAEKGMVGTRRDTRNQDQMRAHGARVRTQQPRPQQASRTVSVDAQHAQDPCTASCGTEGSADLQHARRGGAPRASRRKRASQQQRQPPLDNTAHTQLRHTSSATHQHHDSATHQYDSSVPHQRADDVTVEPEGQTATTASNVHSTDSTRVSKSRLANIQKRAFARRPKTAGAYCSVWWLSCTVEDVAAAFEARAEAVCEAARQLHPDSAHQLRVKHLPYACVALQQMYKQCGTTQQLKLAMAATAADWRVQQQLPPDASMHRRRATLMAGLLHAARRIWSPELAVEIIAKRHEMGLRCALRPCLRTIKWVGHMSVEQAMFVYNELKSEGLAPSKQFPLPMIRALIQPGVDPQLLRQYLADLDLYGIDVSDATHRILHEAGLSDVIPSLTSNNNTDSAAKEASNPIPRHASSADSVSKSVDAGLNSDGSAVKAAAQQNALCKASHMSNSSDCGAAASSSSSSIPRASHAGVAAETRCDCSTSNKASSVDTQPRAQGHGLQNGANESANAHANARASEIVDDVPPLDSQHANRERGGMVRDATHAMMDGDVMPLAAASDHESSVSKLRGSVEPQHMLERHAVPL